MRPDGQSHLVPCPKCTAPTFRACDGEPQQVCGDCWADDEINARNEWAEAIAEDKTKDGDFTDRGDYEHDYRRDDEGQV